MTLKLKEIKEFKGTIKLITGLHIGSGDTELHIGGTDAPVVKHPHTNEPYIPGSSLKGKMRSLLELKYGFVGSNGGPSTSKLLGNITDNNTKEVCKNILKLFGESASDNSSKSDNSSELELGPTRLSFYDCFITDNTRKNIQEKLLSYTEIKAENVINRITGTAEHPRHIERVVAGLDFDFKVTLKIFGGDDESELKKLINEAIDLLEKDSLGGSGSRGYGKVKFEIQGL